MLSFSWLTGYNETKISMKYIITSLFGVLIMNEYINLSVGGTFPAVKERGEGVYFDIDESGLLLIYNFSNPSEKEIEAVQSDQPFEIRYLVKDGVLVMLTKAGSLNWTDAPYTPWLSSNFGQLPYPDSPSSGYALTFIMVDAATNVIKSLRLIGLGHNFSVNLYREIEALRKDPLDPIVQNQKLRSMANAYTTKQLVSMASQYYKVR